MLKRFYQAKIKAYQQELRVPLYGGINVSPSVDQININVIYIELINTW